MTESNLRTCRRCGRAQPLAEFYKRRSASDGYENYCKSCKREKWGDRRSFPKGKASNLGEKQVISRLKNYGIYAAPGKASVWKWADVVAWGCVRIEVKTSAPHDGRFLFGNRSRVHKLEDNHLVVLVCRYPDTPSYHVFRADDPVFFRDGEAKQGFQYNPDSSYIPDDPRGWLTREIMSAAKDRWILINDIRSEIMADLLSRGIKD